MHRKNSVESRWTSKLGKTFCAISSYFLANYHRLKLSEHGRCMNSTEAMLVIQLHDFKWDDRAPYPTVRTLATRMGLSVRGVRNALHSLEEAGFIQRIADTRGGANRYVLNGLYGALEALMSFDVEAKETAKEVPQAPPPAPAPVWPASEAVRAA